MAWDDQKVEKLRIYWTRGLTASAIATALNKDFPEEGGGVTRNSVIGKAHRMALAARGTSKKSKSPEKRDSISNLNKQKERIGKKSRFRSLLLDKSFPPESPRQLEQLDDKSCRWPSQHHPNEEGFYFCGRPSEENFSYCKLHVLLAFQLDSKFRDQKEELIDKEDGVPDFLEKKVKAAK